MLELFSRAPEVRVPLVPRIAQDLSRFLDAIEADPLITPASVGVRSSLKDVVVRIASWLSASRLCLIRRPGLHRQRAQETQTRQLLSEVR